MLSRRRRSAPEASRPPTFYINGLDSACSTVKGNKVKETWVLVRVGCSVSARELVRVQIICKRARTKLYLTEGEFQRRIRGYYRGGGSPGNAQIHTQRYIPQSIIHQVIDNIRYVKCHLLYAHDTYLLPTNTKEWELSTMLFRANIL